MSVVADRLRQTFHFLRGRRIRFDLSPYQRRLRQINDKAAELAGQTDAQLQRQAQGLVQQARLNDSILNTLRTVNISAEGIDFEQAGLKTPAATWTYIINDNPLGNWSQRPRSSVKRKLKEKLFRWTETWE